MESARRVGTNESIHTYGGGTREYTSLQTWEDAHTVDCVATTTSHVLECYDDAASFNDYVTVAGATTNATYFRIIRPAGVKGQASWQGHDGTPNNGFTLISTTNADLIQLSESNSQVQDIIGKLNINSTNGRNTFTLVTTAGGSFVACIAFDGINVGTGTVGGFTSTASGNVINCLAHNNEVHGFNTSAFSGSPVLTYYNCSSKGNTYGFRIQGNQSSHSRTYKNCLASENSIADFKDDSTLGTTSVTYCASGDATADDWGGAGNRISQTFSFVNSGGDDFHLTGVDAGGRDYGTDLSGDATYPFNDDIDFETHVGTWDIGFDERVIYADSWHPEIQQPVREKVEIIGY